jgi:LDH2 family malate/lactate/ureidoglycolate dehydrogenase
MHRVKAVELQRFSTKIFEAAGTPSDIAMTVSRMLVRANLCGVDSHGVRRIPEYVERIDTGQYKPKERPKILRQKGGTGIIDGRWGFGQPAAMMAMELAIKKARTHGVGTALAIRTNHIGRVADYTELAAENRMIGFGLTNCGPGVAPWQGRDRLLGTNPISFAVPAGKEDGLLVDYATSVSSAGKLEVFKTKGKEVPIGWVQDKAGNDSTDPNILAKGGSLRTFGGYKGYGLNLVVESLGGALTGEGVADEFKGQNGTFMQAINIEFFIPFREFTKGVDQLVKKMRGSSPAVGYSEVLIPGDPERRAVVERSAQGIELNDVVWGSLKKVATRFQIEDPVAL